MIDIVRKFVLAHKDTKIPESHKCEKCKFILCSAYSCECGCTSFCKDHLPTINKCPSCKGELFHVEKKTNFINESYEVKCSECSSQMKLKDFDSHLEGCKNDIVKNFFNSFLFRDIRKFKITTKLMLGKMYNF